jgi:gluconolactonase
MNSSGGLMVKQKLLRYSDWNYSDVWMIIVCLLVSTAQAELDSRTPSQPEKITGGFRFTEGPAADQEGNIYFTDIPNNRIHKWSLDGKLSTFMENSGGANGLMFDKDGNLVACAGGNGKVVSISPRGDLTVLADKFNGKPFNSPNDLWIDPNGGIYFTDPRYGSRENLPQDGEHVYYLSADRKKLVRVISDMVRPNGIIGTPDGKLLYVADHGADKTYVYTVNPDGTLTDKKLFAGQGSDGMTLDSKGNLYLTAQAVTVYSPSGDLIKAIHVPEQPSNLCFGGKNKKNLFITARTSLYSMDMKNSGFYSLTLNDIDGNPVSLSRYEGKVLLIVNVASQCGYTKQYAGLQQLYEKYKDQGFFVLGFPANNFLGQEPGTDSQIKTFCTTKFNVTFPLFSRISVKGKDIHPLYQYLTSPRQNGQFGKPITWNFNKFLIDRDGNTAGYFGTKVEPLDPQITGAVEKALK